MNTLGTIYAPPLLSDRPSLRRAARIEVASLRPSQPSHRFYVSSAYCRMVGLESLGEAEALAKLRGLVAPGVPYDLDYLFDFED